MSMLRSYLILNIRSMNDLPVMERWLLKDHAADTVSQIGPVLERYCSYRAVPHPAECEPYAPYNWRMTEHWWRELPFAGGNLMDQKTLLSEVWPKDYNSILGMPVGAARGYGWGGKPEGPHPPVFAYCPARPTEDFHGKGRLLGDGHNLRWIQAIRYPSGVSEADGEDWFLNMHAKEVCQQPGIRRFVSYKCCAPLTSPFVRINELWYENFDGWRDSVLRTPPTYTAPKWAQHPAYPFLTPWVDFVSQFILEAPTDDFKHHLRPYVTTA